MVGLGPAVGPARDAAADHERDPASRNDEATVFSVGSISANGLCLGISTLTPSPPAAARNPA